MLVLMSTPFSLGQRVYISKPCAYAYAYVAGVLTWLCVYLPYAYAYALMKASSTAVVSIEKGPDINISASISIRINLILQCVNVRIHLTQILSLKLMFMSPVETKLKGKLLLCRFSKLFTFFSVSW